MGRKLFYITFLVLIGLSDGSCFGKRRVHKNRRENEPVLRKPILYNPLSDPNKTVAEHHCNCGSFLFGVVQKIPYLNGCPSCNKIEINFSSVCVRCGMCTAIADKINQTMLDIHEKMSTDEWLNSGEAVLLLRAICDHSFKYFNLREIDGKRLITDECSGSSLISTSADGLWGKELKGLCHEYLNEIGELKLYDHWKNWCNDDGFSLNLRTVLCKNVISTLRDCRSVDDVEEVEVSLKPFQAKMEITIEYDQC